MEYIRRRNNYFMTESGVPWNPIGFNESFTWESMKKDPEGYMSSLSAKGINCLRMMFEYAEDPTGLLETSQGVFNTELTALWKRLFELGERFNIRFLMSPYDTFWQWRNWKDHPYNKKNGGYLNHPSSMITDSETIEVHKKRFRFLIENFSESGALFAWDIWNELHPAYSNESDAGMKDYIDTMSRFIKETEMELWGKTHLQTCSIFGPALLQYPQLGLKDLIFRNENLDFANIHIYDDKSISNPKNTIDAAVMTALYIRESLKEIKDGRPFFDSENGPITAFETTRKSLSEDFDDEYFSNMSWAHLASGGCGSGMRWPYRHPHTLTSGMINTLQSIDQFSQLINWNKFTRFNIMDTVQYSQKNQCKIFACGSSSKFILYVLRNSDLTSRGMYDKKSSPVNMQISIPDVVPGDYRIISWKDDTMQGTLVNQNAVKTPKSINLTFNAVLRRNLCLFIERT